MTITLLLDSTGQFLGENLSVRGGEGMSDSDKMLVFAVVLLAIGWIVLIVVELVLLGILRGVRAVVRALTGRARPALEPAEPEPEPEPEPEDAVPPGYDLDGSG
ncbi:hypothetical protein M2283_001499 [Streptomyces pseudovenezuelae]|uniref:Uncharacterized protein n=2 Tax=Streptomyces pseudovenezuelae TaxID=67350 RepID=A0ABT6LD27_9ACTN|nr:hypothetical protein [Streptomyces pseudovenezuelae]